MEPTKLIPFMLTAISHLGNEEECHGRLWDMWEWVASHLKTSRPDLSGPSSEASSHSISWGSAGCFVAPLPRLLNMKGDDLPTQVMSDFVLQQLVTAIPSRFVCADWRLLYSTEVHGVSLNTLHQRTSGCGCCILAIKDDGDSVFGAFCSEWREPSESASFYGTGETFLFSVERLEGLPPLPSGKDEAPPREAVHVHRWSGENSFFMFSHRDHFAVGSGGHFGLWLDSELLHGTSGPSATFNNQCLCRHPHPGAAMPANSRDAPDVVGEFRCKVLEVWGMEHSAISRQAHLRMLKGL